MSSPESTQWKFELLYLTLPLMQCDCHICTHHSVDAVMIYCAALTRTSISATSDTHDLFRQDEMRPHLNKKWLKVSVSHWAVVMSTKSCEAFVG